MLKNRKIKFKKQRLKNNNGFSIVEIIIYIAISSILVTAVASFGISSFRMKTKNQAMFLIEGQGVSVMQKILSTTRNSEAILSPLSGSANSLNLDVVDALKDPTIFNLVGDTLTISEGNGSSRSMFDPSIKVLSFTTENLSRNNTNGNIRVSFTLQGNNYEKTFYGNATIR